ncbi:YdeI/OmpD-associated family protein [Rhizobium sp. LjRoot30]|uniref:YdeI/OmpD-associated family protein n=1 Tax=Rhizobium sp. LjRoot30 TaxID=3342320 RepID=UPI003ECD3A86
MAERKTNSRVDAILAKEEKWGREFEVLRNIALDCDLSEDLKWGCPCYSLGKANVVLIHGFKEYCAYLFFKGALMTDPDGILIQQTENVQAARQIRFTSLEQIAGMEATLKDYIHKAIAVEKAGLKVEFKKTADFAMPDEFRDRLADDPDLSAAFDALTPGRQKAYLLHFASAKQAKTREARIDKAAPRILEGKGLDD